MSRASRPLVPIHSTRGDSSGKATCCGFTEPLAAELPSSGFGNRAAQSAVCNRDLERGPRPEQPLSQRLRRSASSSGPAGEQGWGYLRRDWLGPSAHPVCIDRQAHLPGKRVCADHGPQEDSRASSSVKSRRPAEQRQAPRWGWAGRLIPTTRQAVGLGNTY